MEDCTAHIGTDMSRRPEQPFYGSTDCGDGEKIWCHAENDRIFSQIVHGNCALQLSVWVEAYARKTTEQVYVVWKIP